MYLFTVEETDENARPKGDVQIGKFVVIR